MYTHTTMSGSDASYHDDDDEAGPPPGGGGSSSRINKMKRNGKRTTADDIDDDDDEDTNDNDNEEDEARAGGEVAMDNNADEEDDDDDHAEEVTASLSKMTKIVNNLIARADSIPFREPGKTFLFFHTTLFLFDSRSGIFDVYPHRQLAQKSEGIACAIRFVVALLT